MLKYYFRPVFIKFALVGYTCIVAFCVALSWAVHFLSKFWGFYLDELSICDAFRNLTSFVQYKKHEYTQQRGLLLLVNLQAKSLQLHQNFTKSNTSPWIFSRFWNCTHGTNFTNCTNFRGVCWERGGDIFQGVAVFA